MKCEIINNEEILETLKRSKEIKEFFNGEFHILNTQRYYNVFLNEVSKIMTISDEIVNVQSATSSDLLKIMEELWDAMIPIDEDHQLVINGWSPYCTIYKKASIEKRHKDLYNAYLYANTEQVIEYKNRECYSTSDETQYSRLLRIFVDNFGFSDPSMTYDFLYSWFKIVKRGFSTNEENRNLALLLISKNNRTGKSRLSEFIAKGVSEYLNTPVTHSTTQRLISRFNHLPKTNGVIILNECTRQPFAYSSTLKDILGNESQEVEYKGINNRVRTNNHNVFIGSANEFIHLEGMEDTRYLNIPLDYLKYNVHGVHDYGRQIINIVKEILAAAPETDCDESKNIIDHLHSWNNKKGDDTEWLRDLYLAVDGDVNELKKQLVDFNNRPLTGKKAIAAKIAQLVNVYNGGVMTSKAIAGLAYKIAKYDDIFSYVGKRYHIVDYIFENVNFADAEEKNNNGNSRPWAESPICQYYSQPSQPAQTNPSIIYQVQPPSLHPQPSVQTQPPSEQMKIEPASTVDFDFDPEWSDPDAPENVKYEPFTVGDMVLYLPVQWEEDEKEGEKEGENIIDLNTPGLSSAPQVVVPPMDNNYFLGENGELFWDLSTIDYLEKLKCPWKK